MTTTITTPAASVGALTVVQLRHPQGCRSYLIADPASGEALALDVHLDLVDAASERVHGEGWTLRWVVDSHTHADHPSGAGKIAQAFGATRVAHAAGRHVGVSHHPRDGEELALGEQALRVLHAPGHTPDHVVLVSQGALFSGDTLLIGGVARTDFLGGDAGTLFDTLQRMLSELDDATVVYPGHDYEGREHTTIGAERAGNAWLAMQRDEFVRQLVANPPPRPANMDGLLRLNRAGVDLAPAITAAEAAEHVESGGATSVIDVRSGVEYEGEHVPGSRLISLDQLESRLDEVRATPAPRLLLCRTGGRAELARETLSKLGLGGLSVVEGGIEAFVRAGGPTEKGRSVISLERQVRMGAGFLVLVGVALGAFVHPGFLALAAFVGVGQVFAGLTDWCGMGLLLARAPWNQRSSVPAAQAGGACAASAPAACAASAPAACAATPPAQGD